MSRRFTRTELLGADLVFLLAIEWAGRTYRWSSRPCDPLDADGAAVPHDGGLPAVEFAERFSLLSLSPDTRSISLELDFGVEVAALVQQGHDLSAATGELSLWRDGDTYEERRILLSGRVVEPEYGAEGEPVALTLEQTLGADGALIPASTARVTTTTWDDPHSGSKGRYYPIVFGTPGAFRDTDGTSATTSGSPALVVTWDAVEERADKLLIAGHRVGASSVRVYSADGQESVDVDVDHEQDGLGREVAVVSLTAEDPAFRADAEYWIGWREGGGLISDAGTDAIEGAGDLLVWMLRRASVPVDLNRFQAVRVPLNRYKVSGYIDESVSPWEWLVDNLLPLLPVSLVSGADGVYPVVWRLDATASDAVEEVVAGPGVVRAGPVTYLRGPSDLVNEVRLSYALRARTGDFRRVATVRAEPDPGAEEDEFSTHYARISESRYGNQAVAEDTDIVYDTDTAKAVVLWRLRASCTPIRSVTYEAGQEYGWLEPGDVVTLTDDELAFDGQVCLVETVAWVAEDVIDLTLLVVEDPARDG